MADKLKLLLIGYRAYGDWLYTLPVLPYLFDRYDVHIELNNKGYELFHDDTRFIGMTRFDVDSWLRKDPAKVWDLAKERWAMLEKELKPDRIINLLGTLEGECIAERYQPEFHLSAEERRKHFGHKNFYEAIFEKCDISMPDKPKLDNLNFTPEQLLWVWNWRVMNTGKFIIIMPIAGSCSHKVYPEMPRLTHDILKKYPNAVIYLTGDSSVAHAQWEHDGRIKHLCGTMSIKQIILMTKYADMVIGGETGIVVAAGMWGTPKIMLCTASSVYQCCKYHENDYSMQANTECSPCHKAIYNVNDCEQMIKDGEDTYPKCITTFDYSKIMEAVDKVYDLQRSILQQIC